ncbi:uncharacterized protein TRUGW13939_00276 [Talaromyces rugulosus]|uniref:laccase n=1 Tax=Talaromyces rugulosus TaxID=121627 RepID=A0A7H8QGY7_TALRU|nr:uncharacterized protein TRUGW13939_00276 [Talaromyces rugulosus]QKX53200.1 hypothetical protein TRUGW13939_00276 [Talaromyces rugulosus]
MKYLHLLLPLSAAIKLGSTAPNKGTPCSNKANNRADWCRYNIHTDYYTVVPDTGVTREYWWVLEDGILSPDGVPRYTQTINGSYPGPTLFADWGDNVIVHVTNKLTQSNNGTSVHFHGIRQQNNSPNDGVPSITQCPVAPNDTITYKWRATQYGTTWYHSHFGLQAWEGLAGGIIINGPASSNYDEDKGVIFLSDWTHPTPDSLFDYIETVGPPTVNNSLINGTNVWSEDGSTNQVGSRFTTKFESGTSYRLRLINGAIDTHFKFSIDNHDMTVIASDLVPINPYTTEYIDIGIGQRYDVIVNADQSDVAENFWMRAIPQSACATEPYPGNIRGIIYYGDSPDTPTTTNFSIPDSCGDETENLSPIVEKNVSAHPKWSESENVTIIDSGNGIFKWAVNNVSMAVDWKDPSLMQVYKKESNWSTTAGVIELDEANDWAYILVDSTLPIPHPIHLHGHDFFVLAQGTGVYNSSDIGSLSNPPRRDTAMLPSDGYLLLAFQTDNPGAWLMHCHIGWHTSEGLAIQFIERYSEIRGTIKDYSSMKSTCDNWDAWQTFPDIDSGF